MARTRNAAVKKVEEVSGVHEVPKARRRRMRKAPPVVVTTVPVEQPTPAAEPQQPTLPSLVEPSPAPAPEAPMGVVDQVRVAFSRQHLLASVLGFLGGGVIPVTIFTLVHSEAALADYTHAKAYIVAGGMLVSAKTVYQWMREAFDDWSKAFGTTVLLEGAMVCSDTRWLTGVLLVYLVAVNGIAAACLLALKARKR